MISLASRLPVLQVGEYQLHGYETSWILTSIEEGLKGIGIQDRKIAKDIYAGVLHYLENNCPWKPLRIEDLYAKLEKLFGKIGFPQVKGKIPRVSPPIHMSVVEQLEKMDCQIELALFNTLQSEMETLLGYGVEKVVFDGVIEAVNMIIPTKKWSKECDLLHDEIIALQEKFNDPYGRESYFTPRFDRA